MLLENVAADVYLVVLVLSYVVKMTLFSLSLRLFAWQVSTAVLSITAKAKKKEKEKKEKEEEKMEVVSGKSSTL